MTYITVEDASSLYALSSDMEVSRWAIARYAMKLIEELEAEGVYDRGGVYREVSSHCRGERPRPDTIRRWCEALEGLGDKLVQECEETLTLHHAVLDKALSKAGLCKRGAAIKWAVSNHDISGKATYAHFCKDRPVAWHVKMVDILKDPERISDYEDVDLRRRLARWRLEGEALSRELG